MYKVGPDHQCLVCGRIYNGAHVEHGYLRFGPICTNTDDSCLVQMLGPDDEEELQDEMDDKGRIWGEWGRKLPRHLLTLILEFYPRLEPNDILAQALSRLTFRKLLPYTVVLRIVDFYDVM